MADILAEVKRGALRTLYRQAGDGVALIDVLDSFQDGAFSSIAGGRQVTAHSSNGHSTTFALPQIWQTLQQDEFFALTEELQQVYADAKANLVAQGTASPTDEQIFNSMLADYRLQAVCRWQQDYSTLRYPTRL